MNRLSSIKNHALFSISILLPMFTSLALFVLIPASLRSDSALSLAKLMWFTGFIFVSTNLIGWLYGSPHSHDNRSLKHYEEQGWPAYATLVVSYVSRGNNAVALRRAVRETKRVLKQMDTKSSIEVVTDIRVRISGVDNYLVPQAYSTQKGALYKARALQYLLEQRRRRLLHRHNVWVLHLDEESVVTPSSIAGIADFIRQYKGKKVIGQGEIQYNAFNYANNLVIAAIDSIRTGDDLGRFRLQYKLFKKPLFGMHGSFILLPRTLEQHISFDLTENGSITEDAYFALIAMSQGYAFHWVNGYIREQSPFSIHELLKQRRRWIAGLRCLVADRDIPLKNRLILGLNMILWRLAWVGPIVTLWNIVAGGSVVPFYAAATAAVLSGVVGSVYMVGAWRNASSSLLPHSKKLVVWLSSLVLFPLSCFIEGLAIIYAALFPVKTFQVVDK